MNLNEKYKSLFDKYGVDTKLRICHFMAQITAESGLKLVRESLYYKTAKGLSDAFDTPFEKKSDSFVRGFIGDSIKTANYVYSNRMGNGNQDSGDGYKYRGGGYIQGTGKDFYSTLTKATGIDFVENPDLILIEENAIEAALCFWKIHGLNDFADKDNLDTISDIINIGHRTVNIGDSNGYEHRKKLLIIYKNTIK